MLFASFFLTNCCVRHLLLLSFTFVCCFFSICWLNMRFVFCVWMFLVVSSVLIFPFAYLPFYFTLSLFVSMLCIQYNRGNIVILFLFFLFSSSVCLYFRNVCMCLCCVYRYASFRRKKNEDGTPSSKYLFSVISSVKRRASIIQEEMTCVFCCLLVF